MLYLIAVNLFLFFGELCDQMPESKTPVLDKKRPVDEVDSEIVKLRAFAETRFQHWIKRIQGDYLAKRASALTMEWQKEGKNVPEMLAGMATLLQVGLEPERMLDLVVAWEDVASVRYDCAAMKFKPVGTQMGGGAPTGAPHAVEFLHQEIADLRRKLDAQSAAQSKAKSAKTDCLKGVLTAELIEEFLQEPAIPEWMTDLCQLLTKALDEELLEDTSSGSESGEETYYMGKFKFIVRDGTEFLIANNGREWRTDKRPPGDCDKCGGRHWEWLCGKGKSKK